MALDTHNAASFWNKALLDNSARPSGALVYAGPDGAHLMDEQFTRLKEELEENFSGSVNAGRPLLLEGGLDWKALSLSPKDMDFTEAKAAAARDIALAFGIPPTIDQNRDIVDQIASGPIDGEDTVRINAWFDSPTGKEAYAPSRGAQFEIRATYGVAVVLRYDPTSPRGYRVITAFPINR